MQQLAPDFWNLRGTFKVAGLRDVGTQLSVLCRCDGRFVVLNSFTPSEPQRRALLALTAAPPFACAAHSAVRELPAHG